MGEDERSREPAQDVLRLREAFASLSERARPRADCPEPQRIWAAATQDLRARARRELVDHTLVCSACAEALRLAQEVARAAADDEVSARRSSWARYSLGIRWSWSFGAIAGAAAAVLLSVAIIARVDRTPLDPQRRMANAPVVSLPPAEFPAPPPPAAPEAAVPPGDSITFAERIAPGVEGGVPGGGEGGVVAGLLAAPAPVQAVRVDGQIKEPKKLKDVRPKYPDIAKQARVQGIVILECTISPQGKVTDVKVLRGIPLLDAAAIEAVKQWVYTPTLLNGVPVPVIMTVTIHFSLKQE